MAKHGGEIENMGRRESKRDRFYMWMSALRGTLRLMRSDLTGPVNIGSEEMLAINDFATMIAEISGKSVTIRNVPGPEGLRGPNSDNDLMRERLGWAPEPPLREGIVETYNWIMQGIKEESMPNEGQAIVQSLASLPSKRAAEGP